MKTILVPIDLSPAAVQVCDAACDLAKLTKSRLILLHIVQAPPIVMSEVYAFDDGQLTEMIAGAKRVGAKKLQALEHRCKKRGVRVTAVQSTGAPVAAILAKAVSARAGCIVMGTHGHNAVYDLLVGSTTHGVLKQAPCPVMIIPAAKRRATLRG
jgi:nucleotide-binding universal stress UspA family protein